MTAAPKTLYETDFRLWLAEQATLLRTRHVDKLDCDNLAEELQSIFESQENELRESIQKLAARMAGWIDGSGRTPDAYAAIVDLRMMVNLRLEMSPSLEPRAVHYFDEIERCEVKLTRGDLMDRLLEQDD